MNYIDGYVPMEKQDYSYHKGKSKKLFTSYFTECNQLNE